MVTSFLLLAEEAAKVISCFYDKSNVVVLFETVFLAGEDAGLLIEGPLQLIFDFFYKKNL